MFQVVSDKELGFGLGLQDQAEDDGVVDPPIKRVHEMEEEDSLRRELESGHRGKHEHVCSQEQNQLVRGTAQSQRQHKQNGREA